jgi:hypothetical protein
MSCIGIGIGLFDKGQSYIGELCQTLSIRKPTAMEDIASFVVAEICAARPTFNGSIVEFTSGLSNYERAIEFLAANSA